MTKLDIKDLKTLQEGLYALTQKCKSKRGKNKKILKRIKEAEDALMIIGIY